MNKKILLFIFVFFVASSMFAQVNFELDFSIEKQNTEDHLRSLWLDDLDNNGEDEIYANYVISSYVDSLNIWKLISYDLNGDTINVFSQQYSRQNRFLKCKLIKYLDDLYLIATYEKKVGSDSYYDYLHIRIYDWNTLSLIDSTSYEIGYVYSWGWTTTGTYLNRVNCIKPILIQDEFTIHIGVTKRYMYYDDEHSDLEDTSYLFKYGFANNILTFIEDLPNCGWSLISYPDYDKIITTGYYNYTNNWTQAGEIVHKYYLKLLTYDNPTDPLPVFYISGNYYWDDISGVTYYNHYPKDFKILTSMDSCFNVYGMIIHSQIWDSTYPYDISQTFWCYSPDFSDTLWISQHIGTCFEMFNIKKSACVETNLGNNYIMYFERKIYPNYSSKLEIRDRINGNIVLSQDSVFIPCNILRKSDGELLFFVEQGDDTGYDVYVLEDEIHLSIDNGEIPVTNCKLYNYPNPFTTSTTISFNLATRLRSASPGQAEIKIYNIKGQLVKQLKIENVKCKINEVVWNGKDENGNSLSNGIYFYKLNIKNSPIKKMLLLR